MIVFFTASLKLKEIYQKYYDVIVKTIQKEHKIISLEVQDYSYLIPKNLLKSLTQNEIHYMWIKKGIYKSNCVIIEASRDSFRLGHEATLALLYNKPVLCLSSIQNYADSIVNNKFYAAQYKNEKDIIFEVEKFLDTVKSKHLSFRKNIYITPEHANFLSWYAKKNSKSDSEVLRDLIARLMNNYPNYQEGINLFDLSNEE